MIDGSYINLIGGVVHLLVNDANIDILVLVVAFDKSLSNVDSPNFVHFDEKVGGIYSCTVRNNKGSLELCNSAELTIWAPSD